MLEEPKSSAVYYVIGFMKPIHLQFRHLSINVGLTCNKFKKNKTALQNIGLFYN